MYLDTTLSAVQDGAVVCKDKTGKPFTVACDSVISSAGYLPAPPEGKAPKIGDCDRVGNLRTVIWGAYEAAMKI